MAVIHRISHAPEPAFRARSILGAPMIIADEMPATRHMGDGNYYTSKRKFRAVTKAHGCVEVGNDPAMFRRQPKPEPDRQAVKAAVGRARQDIRQIETSLNLYRLDNFRYPTTAEGLQALVTNPGETAAPNWKQVLKSVPVDPWDQPYHYASPGQRGEFDVYTYGADRQEGGEGINADIGNWDL